MALMNKKTNMTALVLASMLGLPAIAAPTTDQVIVSGYLKRSSPVTESNAPVTVQLKGGVTNVTGCSYSGQTNVSDGYFSVTVPCTSTNLNAASGALTAEVVITISGSAQTLTVNAYPVPMALVATVANGVAASSITNASIAAAAAIDLSKLSVTGATSGDVVRYNGTAWIPSTLSTASIATTGGANSFSGTQTFAGTGTGLSVTNAATIGNGLTVSAGGATITAGGLTVSAGGAAITGNSTITGTATVSSDASVGGNLSVTGTTTSGGALTVTTGGATVTAGGLTVTAGGLAVNGGNVVIGTGGGYIVDSSTTIASGTTYNNAAPFPVVKGVYFVTGTTATTITCIAAGVAGQRLTIVFTGNIGTSVTFTHNSGTCTGSSHKVISPTAGASLLSTTAASVAAFELVSDGTQWYFTSPAQ